MSNFGNIDDCCQTALQPSGVMPQQHILCPGNSANGIFSGATMNGGPMHEYGDHSHPIPLPQYPQDMDGSQFASQNPLSASSMRHSPLATSSSWVPAPSPSTVICPPNLPPPKLTLRYPVLRPLLPHISSIIPIGLACDLLELYFSSASQTFLQPQSPYVLCYLFRRRSFLHPDSPRVCSSALLASMLWVAAQTSESAYLNSPPSARGQICQELFNLTVALLKPLIHNPTDRSQPYDGMDTITDGVRLAGPSVALHTPAQAREDVSAGTTSALDDIATYIHLAVVVSASECKAASLRWWNVAWSLARELKLGRELPADSSPYSPHSQEGNSPGRTRFVSEEEREERRRIWWLLYINDRHLALCYNRPLFLLDAECDGLLQPDYEAAWQAAEVYMPSAHHRRRGPSFECTGHSLFGYFLPIMTILGEIVDLNQARNHPHFGKRFVSEAHIIMEIGQQLDVYGRSLKELEASYIEPTESSDNAINVTSPHSIKATASSHPPRMTESVLRTRTVVAYGTHLMHTMHILLHGKWDPISLLDDSDLWISTQSFFSAAQHAVLAAEAIDKILDYDPDLSFFPYFFGIYLLQGSLLLLVIADKLQGEASHSVIKACESTVRAHEACVVTLNTEYQRHFRKVMRSVLAQVHGRTQAGSDEQKLRRREVLALYRWTGSGTGLAL